MNPPTEAYPLQWPVGWPRTKRPQPARFDTSFAIARDAMLHEIQLLGGRNIIISSNMKIRNDGLPYAQQGRIEDVGIAVYFELNGNNQCIPCDKWDSLKDNLQAIRKTVEALRGLERWGAKEMVDAAFQGFKALPESVIVTGSKAWWEILEVPSDAPAHVIVGAYKQLRRVKHPDAGGSDYEWNQLQEAFKQSGADL